MHAHPIHDSFDLPHSPSQIAAPSFQPFVHSRCHILPISYIAASHPPQNCFFFRGRSGHPSNTWLLGPTQPTNPNEILIESSVFPQYTAVTNKQTYRRTGKTANIGINRYQNGRFLYKCATQPKNSYPTINTRIAVKFHRQGLNSRKCRRCTRMGHIFTRTVGRTRAEIVSVGEPSSPLSLYFL